MNKYQIVKKDELTPDISRISVYAPLIAKKAQPGQFIILRVDENGERITFYQIEWINPRPEEVIANVAYRPVDDASDLYVGRIVGVKK